MGWAKGVYWSVLFIYPSDHENKLFSFFFLVLSLCTGNPQHMPVQIYEQCVFWRISFIKCKFLWPMIDYRTAQKAANKYYLTMYLKKKKTQTGGDDFICHFPSNLSFSLRRQVSCSTAPGFCSGVHLVWKWALMLSKRQPCKTGDHFLYFNIFYLFQLGNSTRCRPEGIEPQTSLTLRDSKPHQFLETASLCFQPWGSIINKKKLPHVCTAVSRKAVQSPLGHFYLSSSTWG